MLNDTLKDIFLEIQKYCEGNGISIFKGEPYGADDDPCMWVQDDSSEWRNYLDVCKNIGVKIIHLTADVNEFEGSDKESMQKYESTLPEDERIDFEKSLATVEKCKGYTLSIHMIFIHQSVCYMYSEYAPWWSDYHKIMHKDYDEEDDEEDDEDDDEDDETNRDLSLNIEDEARKLINNNRYISSKNSKTRRDIARELLLEEGSHIGHKWWQIANRAEGIFAKEVQPKIDEEIKNKIIELKRQNSKLTKTAAAGILSMTEREINKHWFKT